jgi:hypothetical protein
MDCVNNQSVHHCMTFHWSPFVRCCVYYKSHLCTALNTQNTAENKCIIWHASNTTAVQSNVYLTGTHRLLVTKGGRPSPEQTTPSSTVNAFVTISTSILTDGQLNSKFWGCDMLWHSGNFFFIPNTFIWSSLTNISTTLISGSYFDSARHYNPWQQ